MKNGSGRERFVFSSIPESEVLLVDKRVVVDDGYGQASHTRFFHQGVYKGSQGVGRQGRRIKSCDGACVGKNRKGCHYLYARVDTEIYPGHYDQNSDHNGPEEADEKALCRDLHDA